MHHFQREGVLPQRGKQRLQPGIYRRNTFAVHGAGCINTDIDGQLFSHGCSSNWRNLCGFAGMGKYGLPWDVRYTYS